jgi:hypothetical protein
LDTTIRSGCAATVEVLAWASGVGDDASEEHPATEAAKTTARIMPMSV